jgi:hypothetical protein
MIFIAPTQVQDQRTQTCVSCDKFALMPISKAMKCIECGCFIRMKVALTNAECPLGKWGAYQPDNPNAPA